MIAAKSTSRRAFASVQQARSRTLLQHKAPALGQHYSTTKETAGKASSSHVPWILGATVITAGGLWFTLPSSKPTSHHEHPTIAKAKAALSPEDEKKRQAHKDFLESMKADAPKTERRGPSEFNHEKAAEANEHLIRKGKFSGKEFDNHITKHSGDPGKDFEFIEKKEAEEAAK